MLKNDNTKTNVDTLAGSVFTLYEEINPEQNGSVKINGVVWTAQTEKEQTIKKGEKVVVKKVEGNKLIVEKQKERKENK